MITAANVNPQNAFLDYLSWDFSASQPTPSDAELVKQLSFIPGLKEILMLRQVHALEHATVWVLSEAQTSNLDNSSPNQVDNSLLGGFSTEEGFYLYGQVSKVTLERAVRVALQRLTSGEWNLAVHPRCGTNVSVGIILAAGLALGFHLLLPRSPIEQLFGFGLATSMAAHLAPTAGIFAQRYLTTAIPFNLAIETIKIAPDAWGKPAYFVQVRWAE